MKHPDRKSPRWGLIACVTIGLLLVYGVVSVVGGTLGDVKSSTRFLEARIPEVAQPWNVASLRQVLGNRYSDAEVETLVRDAKSRFGDLLRFRIPSCSPSRTRLNGATVSSYSFAVPMVCEKGEAMANVELVRSGESWKAVNFTLFDGTQFPDSMRLK